MKILPIDWKKQSAFSLVEVVLALGVISFAIVAIIGVIPTGLQTSHSSQDETRAAQIAQSIFGSLTGQNLKRDVSGQLALDSNGHIQLNDAVKVPVASSQTLVIDLTASATPTAPDLFADNNGQLTQTSASATYAVTITKNTSPPGFDPPSGSEVFINEVTISVAWPASAPNANQTKRDFTRILSKY